MTEILFDDILEAKKLGPEALNEASLSRVYQHFTKSGEKSFGVVTSWRIKTARGKPFSNEANIENFNRLKNTIRGLGLGYFVLKGHWRQCSDSNAKYGDCPPEKLLDTVEPSLFVPGLSWEEALAVAKEYEQDALIWSGPKTKGGVVLLYKTGKTKSLGKFRPDKIAQGYSESRGGRSFKFEGFEYPVQNWIEALIASVDRK